MPDSSNFFGRRTISYSLTKPQRHCYLNPNSEFFFNYICYYFRLKWSGDIKKMLLKILKLHFSTKDGWFCVDFNVKISWGWCRCRVKYNTSFGPVMFTSCLFCKFNKYAMHVCVIVFSYYTFNVNFIWMTRASKYY